MSDTGKVSEDKMQAIYDLREAAERKGRAAEALDRDPSPDKRDDLLEAHLDVEEQTVRALEVCEECGRTHAPDQGHGESVVRVDFERKERR